MLLLSSPLVATPEVYLTGNAEDKRVPASGGILLSGGGGDVDSAMAWLLDKANGGDVVVLRASGSDGYNDYMHTELGVTVNSVRSIVFKEPEDAFDDRIRKWIEQAELVFLAGGDQAKYYRFWKGTPIQEALNAHLASRKPIGGTSAGLAVLGEFAYVALHDEDLTSELAMRDQDSPLLTLSQGFLSAPLLRNLLTDSHFSERNRLGRLMVMLNKAKAGSEDPVMGIGIDERTAICVEADGSSKVHAKGTGTASLVSLASAGNAQGSLSAKVVKMGDGVVFDINQTEEARGSVSAAYVINGYIRQFPISRQCDLPINPPSGKLIIVGGGLRASNDEIFNELIQSAKLDSDGSIGIIPAASGKPAKYANAFRQILLKRGVECERIVTLPIAVNDDSGTDEDESLWEKNAWDAEVVKRVRKCTAIWFIGGDQARIMQVLSPAGKGDTPLYEAIRDIYWNGGVVGGTSAGAAIQSELMILGGSSPAALRTGITSKYSGMDEQESGPLILGEGVGFFPHGVIDQHFDRKARLGRLVVAVLNGSETFAHGYGIDEDTALVYDAANDSAVVVGSGTVAHLDLSEVSESEGNISNIRISVLCSGDRITWPGNKVAVSPVKSLTNDNEFLSIKDPDAAGLMSPYGGRLADALGFLLVDNKLSQQVTSVVSYPDGARRELVFSADEETLGYWGYVDGNMDSYTTVNAALEIGPLKAGAD
ncbi:MAG: cyanophycinase [Puniceicoccaceae bacterium]